VDGDLPLEEWRALVAGASGSAARRTLVSSVAWTSPLNAPALLADPEAGWRLWKRLADPEAEASPVVLRTGRGPHPYPVPLPHLPSEPAPTLVEALRRARTAEGEPEPGAALLLPPSLVRALDRTLDGLRRRLTTLEAEREGLADPDDLRTTGDLLLARFHEVPTGAERVVLTDFAGEAVEVALDPTLPPQENADRYYDRAARAERARERLPALVARTRARVEGLEALEARVRAGEATREEVEAALPPEALRAEEEGSRSEDRGPSLPYRRFRSTGGLEIRVGKGPRENDDLTFHHSSPDDVWLHAQQVAGAHVILRWGRKETPPSRDLAEAAVLAALHSKARTSGSVPVQWTFRKYVRSPRKAPPGLVVPDRVQTVFVEPDAGVAERLSVEE
jgi:predicted ribosome quality control (RQC) complex YloA/Tae2 family protein